jgi:BirA family biotin operon repressor/biotin-[acetyl-CoA-carboxylase] ligase
VLLELDRLLGDPDLTARYRERLATLGSRVRAELPDGRTITGVAVDIDAEGRLRVEDDNVVVSLDVGDIVHLRPA